MTISIWRYSHLALAVSSFLLIALAAVTGIILSFEPVLLKTLPYKVDRFNEITLAESLPAIKAQFLEVTDLSVDANQFVVVNGVNNDGKSITVYVDPQTGKTLGIPGKQSEFFQWVTALHRSLFLHELGRFFVGLTSFLLLLIASSGTVLILQRQRGIKRFFTKIVRENFAQYYHVTLGRLLLIPILIITISGTYLSLLRFNVIPEPKITHDIDFDSIKTTPKLKLSNIKFFKATRLSEVQSVEFPFSEDVEDYYTFKLKDREVTLNQITGDILTERLYPATALLTNLNPDLHTGRASGIWAIVLALASANIVFFIYSGFAITLKRISGRIKNKFKAEEATHIILVGSENGSTNRFATSLYKQLIKEGLKCFNSKLNNYRTYPAAEHIIVFAATYGLGDPPTNASKFLKLLETIPQRNGIKFSVLGFGSTSYPDFCQYAFEINNAISHQNWSVPFVEIHTVNDKSPTDFNQWVTLWSQKSELSITVPVKLLDHKPKKLKDFKVVSRTEIAHVEGAFLIRLKPQNKLPFSSGDLLAIYPANDHRERLYSIGRIESDLNLSVRLHSGGLGSEFLHRLEVGQSIKGTVQSNPQFYFPKRASNVIMISNGTGIAPFLGMIANNRNKVQCQLYAGFRCTRSFSLYEGLIKSSLEKGQLASLNLAYSREGEKQYVKDLLARDKEFVATTLKTGGVIMLCGSLAMQKDLIELFETICQEHHQKSVSFYQAHNQILMDCY
ncbi:MAG: PepSY domain-containing protein [Pedobacter sp.]